jgi:signal transduction histidine kinase
VRQNLWRWIRGYFFDALIVLGAVFGVFEIVLRRNAPDAPTLPLGVAATAEALLTLTLLARRRFPFGAPTAMLVAAAALSFVDGRLIPFTLPGFLSALAACLLFGLLPERRQAVAGLAIALAVGVIAVRNDPGGTPDDYFGIPFVFTAVWVVGFALGRQLAHTREAEQRAARAEREREERTRAAVGEERARIARELHDVVGHSVSVMTVQASAVRRLLRPDQEREREALLVVEQTGREALAEMRRMVGVLRRPEEAPALAPQPSLEHLDRLIEQVREAGLDVEVRIEGAPAQLPPGVDLTAYRLIQEGLTNALKHAHASRAIVLVRYGDGEVELVVSDNGRGDGNVQAGGHGLVGMRERVSVYGGELEAGPRAEGGYALRARLPVGAV